MSPTTDKRRHMATLARLATVIMALGAAMASCNTSGCTDNQNSLPLAGFYSAATGEAVTLDSLGVAGIGAPRDSMLVRPGEAVSQVYLPLRSQHASTSYCLSYRVNGVNDPLMNDTVTMVYSSWPYFNGEECGASYRYSITSLDYTRHLVDSVGLVDREVTNVDREIIRIYFRVAEEPADTSAMEGWNE